MHYGQRQGRNVKPFVDENEALQQYLEKNWLLLTPKSLQDPYDRLFTELEQINKQLWELEDEIRSLKHKLGMMSMSAKEAACLLSGNIQRPECLRIIEIGLVVPELNDRRAATVQKLNALFGITSQEKVYQS